MHDTVTSEHINEYKEFLVDLYEAEFGLVDEPTRSGLQSPSMHRIIH